MKTKEKIVIRQEEFINSLICEIKKFVENLDKSEIQTILLSGSVSRGDFFPGDFGGMVDLIVIRKANSKIKPEEVFGPNKKTFIPYHCVALEENDLNGNVIWLQIDFRDKLNVDVFSKIVRRYMWGCKISLNSSCIIDFILSRSSFFISFHFSIKSKERIKSSSTSFFL